MPRQKQTATAAPLFDRPPQNRAACYIRVSTEEQVSDGYGMDVQRQQCNAYAMAFGLTVVNTYADEGISGTKDIEEREQLKAAIESAQRGEYDTLIVPAIDRLARKAALLLKLWDVFESAGVAIVAVKERIDTSTPSGRFARTMFAAVAEFERDNIVARTSAGRDERGRKDGDRGGLMPFGYKRGENGEMLIDYDAAEVVCNIFAWDMLGVSMRGIARQLNAAGITTQRGHIWHASSVRKVLMNEDKYRGGNRGESATKWIPILE